MLLVSTVFYEDLLNGFPPIFALVEAFWSSKLARRGRFGFEKDRTRHRFRRCKAFSRKGNHLGKFLRKKQLPKVAVLKEKSDLSFLLKTLAG